MSTSNTTLHDSIDREVAPGVDPETTVWLGASCYHADRSGIPACPEHFDDLEESTLAEAVDEGLVPCEACEPVDYRGAYASDGGVEPGADDDVGHGPRTAWLDGILVDEPHGLDGDEVRLHDPSGTVLVRKDVDVDHRDDVDDMKPELARAVAAARQVAELTGDQVEA